MRRLPQALPQGEGIAETIPARRRKLPAAHCCRWAAPRVRRLAATLLAVVAWTAGAAAQEADGVERGEYLFRAAGGCTCHTDFARGGAFLAGGRPLKTPFGTFYAPNITPHRETGIGGWSGADFAGAMRDGTTPDGDHYFPAFPYTLSPTSPTPTWPT